MPISIDPMSQRPFAKFQLGEQEFSISGVDSDLYQIITPVGSTIFVEKMRDGNLALPGQSAELQSIDTHQLLEAVTPIVTEQFDELAYIGLMKRDIETTQAFINSLKLEINAQQERLEKLKGQLAQKENPGHVINLSRWKASIALEPVWSLIDCVDDMREHVPKLIVLIEASGGLFSGTDFVERLKKTSEDGDLIAFEDVVEAIMDYADVNNIWIRG